MSHSLVIGLASVVAASIGMLIKWEFKRFQRGPRSSKAFTRHMESLRDAEPGRAYTAPPERSKRSLQDSTKNR